MNQAEEDLLVLAAQNGSHQAFAMIYRRYQKPLLHYAFKVCGDQEIAQDAVQESWIKSASSIRKLKDPRALRSWLYRLVHWRVLDLARQSTYHKAKMEEFEEDKHSAIDSRLGVIGTGIEGEMESDALAKNIENTAELSQAIKRLPPIEKQIIHLFYLDELKVSEISIVLEIPEGTVKSRLNRARKLLKQRFGNNN